MSRRRLHIVILTRRLPPAVCGIGDHTVALTRALEALGHCVTLVAGEGRQQQDRLLHRFWDTGQGELERRLHAMPVDHLVLQYTPLAYAADTYGGNRLLARWWAQCARHWNTSLILHETYFRTWWHPPSLARGTVEKLVMQRMVAGSKHVYTASQPLFDAVNSWRSGARVTRLPIGSNVPRASVNRSTVRAAHGIGDEETVLLVFGGGEGLRRYRHYVDAVDELLATKRIAARWLLLGGVRPDWFTLRLPVVAPGVLPLDELSAWLQASDVFLMPHVSGLCAKRGTLMAALQHGLPVVGTAGPMTDPWWSKVQGVRLTPGGAVSEYARAVRTLVESPAEQREMGALNSEYFERACTWERIAASLVASWEGHEP